MARTSAIGLVIAVTATGLLATSRPQQSIPVCRHDGAETESDRARREQALAFTRTINSQQGAAAERTRRYHPLAALPAVPDVPEGFELSFYSDDAGYILSLKDVRDPCRYAVFSDQHGLVYEAPALRAPLLAQ